MYVVVLLCKQKTAYEMRISYWSSDVCSSDLQCVEHIAGPVAERGQIGGGARLTDAKVVAVAHHRCEQSCIGIVLGDDRGVGVAGLIDRDRLRRGRCGRGRSEEHTSELQSLMRHSYAVFCLKKKQTNTTTKK